MSPLTHTIISSLDPRTTRLRQRTGKIARLPKSVRECINHLLDEGYEYSAILKDLGPHAAGLNHQNLTNWRKGGYQDHLRQQELIQNTKAQTEAAAELVHEMADVTVPQLLEACDKVAATQLLDVIFEHGETALARTLKEQPAKYLNLMDITCNMSNAAIKAQKHHLAMSSSKSSSSSSSIPKPSPREKEKANLEFIANIQAELRKRYYSSSSEAPIKPNQASETILVRTDSTPFLIETPAVEITPAAEDGAFKPNQPSKNIRIPAADCTQSRMPAVPASQSKIIPPIAGQNSKMPTKPNQASTNDSHSSADRIAAENHRPPQGNTVDSKLIIIDVLGTVGMKSRPAAKPGRILMPPPSPRRGEFDIPKGSIAPLIAKR